MNEAGIYHALTDLARDIFDDDEIVLRPETRAPDIPGWDSQGNIMFLVAAEQRFGVHFRPSEFESLRQVGDLVALISIKLT